MRIGQANNFYRRPSGRCGRGPNRIAIAVIRHGIYPQTRYIVAVADFIHTGILGKFLQAAILGFCSLPFCDGKDARTKKGNVEEISSDSARSHVAACPGSVCAQTVITRVPPFDEGFRTWHTLLPPDTLCSAIRGNASPLPARLRIYRVVGNGIRSWLRYNNRC